MANLDKVPILNKNKWNSLFKGSHHNMLPHYYLPTTSEAIYYGNDITRHNKIKFNSEYEGIEIYFHFNVFEDDKEH